MGAGKSIPVANDTRWNSTYRQLEAIASFDATSLSSVLQQTHHDNIVISGQRVENRSTNKLKS